MLTGPLPHTLDVRKAAVRGELVSGALKPEQLQRFRDLLANDQGAIEAQLACSRDEENRYLVAASVVAEVSVTCQRCLEPMQIDVATENTLAIVWSEDQARSLPRHLEPLVLSQETCNLWLLVEDELILGLPAFSYHERLDCNKLLAELAADKAGVAASAEADTRERPNPFDVLAQLKPGSKEHKE